MNLKMSTFTKRTLNRRGLGACLPEELRVEYVLGAVVFRLGGYIHSTSLYKKEIVVVLLTSDVMDVWKEVVAVGSYYRRSQEVLDRMEELKSFLEKKLGTIDSKYSRFYQIWNSTPKEDEIVRYIQLHYSKKSKNYKYIVLYTE